MFNKISLANPFDGKNVLRAKCGYLSLAESVKILIIRQLNSDIKPNKKIYGVRPFVA